ncbi:MAG TPA: SIS domain-containing protein [Solirubrobacteraceae bacterium]|nr:SIS domain-containing protein [Solirubrobacteraceae bacterium]
MGPDHKTVDFRQAIFDQAENLRSGSAAFRDAVAEVDLRALCEGTIVLGGIGASAHALIPAVLALRAAGRRAFAVSAAELREANAAQLGDAFVLVSQSGASAETVAALERIEGAPVVAISAHGDSPLARAAQAWLPLGPLPDTPVATLSYTATLQALGMLCGVLLGPSNIDSAWEQLPELAAALIERADPVVEELAGPFAAVRALDAIGSGPAAASAGETALLAREGLRLPASGIETREYLHGPLEAVGEGFGCVVFGRAREHGLAAALASFGAAVVLLTDEAPSNGVGVPVLELPRVPDLAAPVLQILPVQLLADHVARLRGIEIGQLRRQQDDTKVA